MLFFGHNLPKPNLYPFNKKQSSTLGPVTLHLNISTLFPVSWGISCSTFSFSLLLFDFRLFFCLTFFIIAIAIKTTPLQEDIVTLDLHPVLHAIALCYIRSAVVPLGLSAYSFSLFTIHRNI